MFSPIKLAQGIGSLAKKNERVRSIMEKGKASRIAGTYGDETLKFGSINRYPSKKQRWDDLTETQQLLVLNLKNALKKVNPNINDNTAKLQARKLVKLLRKSNASKNFDEREATRKYVNDIIKQASMLGTTGALAKMAEATMIPEEPSFGEQTAEFLMDYLQPLPREFGRTN